MRRFALVWGLLILVALVGPKPLAFAQGGLDDLDDLDDLEGEVITEAPFVAGVEKDKWELVLELGYLDLSGTLVSANDILVDWDDDEEIYGDMSLEGESAFSPQIKLIRSLGKFAVENAVGFALGDYQQTLGDMTNVPEDGSNTLTEEEIDKGSLFVWYHETALTYHPLERGRVLPFLSAGFGRQYYYLDSPYVDGSASSFAFSYGGGIRVIGDDLFSIRVEVRNYHFDLDYRHSAAFSEDEIDPNVDDNLIDIPLRQRNEDGSLSLFEGFGTQSYTNLWYSVGFVASF